MLSFSAGPPATECVRQGGELVVVSTLPADDDTEWFNGNIFLLLDEETISPNDSVSENYRCAFVFPSLIIPYSIQHTTPFRKEIKGRMVERGSPTPTLTQLLPHRSPQQHSHSSSMSTTVPGTLRCTGSTAFYGLNFSITTEYANILHNYCQENKIELKFDDVRSGPENDETWTATVLSKSSLEY